MPTYRVIFIDNAREAVDAVADDIVLRGGAFHALDGGITVAVWVEDVVSYIQRVDPGPNALQYYRCVWRNSAIPESTFPATGIHFAEGLDWLTGWDDIACIGWLRSSNLDSAYLVHSLTGVPPAQVTPVPRPPEPEPIPPPTEPPPTEPPPTEPAPTEPPTEPAPTEPPPTEPAPTEPAPTP